MPIEEETALSQVDLHVHCGPGQFPPSRLADLQNTRAKISIFDLTNKHWQQISWMHRFHKLSALNSRGNPSCYWYNGPLAGTPEWDRISTVEPHTGTGTDEDTMCGFSDLLRNASAGQGIPPVVGFYHVSTVGDRWIKTVRRQLSLLRFSHTHHAVQKVVVGTSGHFADVVPSIASMMEQNKTDEELGMWGDHHKFEFVDHNLKQMYRDLGGSYVAREVPTLQLMYEHCSKDDHAHHWVFYMHSKGVGHHWPKFKWTQDWTRYMETMLFEVPHLCLHALQHGSAACGVELYQIPFLHYAGNFWWTTCERVRQLQEPDQMLPMTESTWGHPENWIGSVGGGSMMSLMTAYETNPYATDLDRNHYMPVATVLPRLSLCPKCQ